MIFRFHQLHLKCWLNIEPGKNAGSSREAVQHKVWGDGGKGKINYKLQQYKRWLNNWKTRCDGWKGKNILINTQFFVKNALFPGGHCPRGAEVGVWRRHCFHQVHLCQIQRPRPSVILHQHQIRFFKLSQSVHGHCGDISALKFWNFFINLLSPPPGWEYGQTKAMQRRTR